MNVVRGPWQPRDDDDAAALALGLAVQDAMRRAASHSPPAAPWRLLPVEVLDLVAQCLEIDEQCGEPWRTSDECDPVTMLWAVRHHLDQHDKGEAIDALSNLPHLVHAAASLLVAIARLEEERDTE